MFSNQDYQRNNIAKKLGGLLPEIDPRVLWVDYIPGDALRNGTPLIAIGIDKTVKYVDISDLSPFKVVNRVLNAMDDYCLQVQFLNDRQVREIQEDLGNLALDRTEVASEALRLLRVSGFDSTICTRIAVKAVEKGILPSFFPDNKEVEITSDILRHFLRNNRTTFMDTQILTDFIKEELRERFVEKMPVIHPKEDLDIAKENLEEEQEDEYYFG